MSITDELRKWGYGFCGDTHDVVTAIADRIDAEHDKALNSVDGAYDSGYNVGYDEGFASADDWLAQHEDAMAEHGWVRGPIGADDKPMAKEHMVVDNGGNVGVIVETRFNDSNWFVLVDFGEGKSARFVWFLPKSLTHYHAPTVEDVLTEFGIDWEHESDCEDRAALLKEYASKLRLAKEDA